MSRFAVRSFSIRHVSLRWALVVVVLVGLCNAARAQAAEKFNNSLDWVPADVAFYSTSLRWKEQIDIVANSKAWAKFKAIPSVATAWAMAEQQLNSPEGPLGIALAMIELPENQQLLQMVGDMFSNEVVIIGGSKTVDLIDAASRCSPPPPAWAPWKRRGCTSATAPTTSS